ncbi:MAG: type VI secretion system protein [Alphaproteobacteria bacterium]
MLAQLLQGYQTYLPLILIGALVLAVLVVILIMIVGKKALAQSRKRQALARPAGAKPTFAQRLEHTQEHLKGIKGWIMGLWGKWRWEPNDDQALSFKQTLKILKEYLPDRHPEYTLPWYMVVGSDQSGKSEILNDLDLELPIGKPNYSVDTQITGVQWSFYDRGVVLEVNGDCFLRDQEISSNNEVWTRLLRLLNRYRARRPLDGIVITLPASELYGPTRLAQIDLMERAKHIYTKLWSLQSVTGMRLPVYMVVTKCDLVPGFKSFATELPATAYNEMFGWSSPYAIDATYGPDWVDDIFDHLHRSLNRLRSEVFAEGQVRSERDGTLLFPLEFFSLKEGIGAYLNGIFKDSSYHESFFLRGVYFSGKATIQGAPVFSQRSVFEDTAVRAQKLDPQQESREKAIFLRDLFEKKIFCESSLARPVRRLLLSTNRLLNFTKMASVVVAVGWIAGIVHNFKTIESGNQTLMPSLKRIDSALQGIDQLGGYQDTPRFREYLNQQATSVLEGFSDLDPVDSFAFFMPSSWLSNIDEHIQDAFTIGYDHIILPSLYSALLKKAEEVVSIGHIDYKNDLRTPFVNPAYSPAFKALNGYVTDVVQLEKQVSNFNELDVTSSVENLGILVRYLFNRDLPKNFFSHTEYYKRALGRIIDRNIDLTHFRVAAGQKLGILFKNFIATSFDVQRNFPLFEKLKRDITNWEDTKILHHLHASDLRKTTERAITVADIIASGDLAWIDNTIFEPSPSYVQMKNDISASHLLGPDLTAELSRIADREFLTFKLHLSDLKTKLTGTFFNIADNRLVGEPSPGLVAVIDALSQYLNEKFMITLGHKPLSTKLDGARLLFWDEETLQKAEEYADAYQSYLQKHLPAALADLQDLFKIVGLNSTRDIVTALIANAQSFQDNPLNSLGFGAQEILHAQVQNVAAAVPHFTKLLGMYDNGGFVNNGVVLRELLVKQNYDILERIEKLLESDNLYNAKEEAFEWWDGSPLVGLKAFGVHTISDMRTYLAAQRFQIAFLAKEMAEPILTLLSLGYLEDVPYDLPLATKWSHIASTLSDYEKQSPGNSLKILEQFLTYDINELSLENCTLEVDDFDGGDYFLEIRNRYATSLQDRCETLRGRKALERYNRAATFFNVNLAGRFPFTKNILRDASSEADPDDVITFFQLFDSLSTKDIEIIKRLSRSSAAKDSLAAFISKIESVRPLMLASLDKGTDKQIPNVKVDVAFRTNRQEERGGNKIIDWSMDFGTGQIDFRGTELTGKWRVGAPVDVNLTWALDSDNVPISDPRNPSLDVVGPNAIFSYEGRWALIRLVREHATDEGKFDQSLTPAPLTLEFLVPTAYNKACYQGDPPLKMDRKSEPARVYCQLSMHIPVTSQLEGPDGLTVTELKRIGMPRFPYEAPVVDPLPLKRRKQD